MMLTKKIHSINKFKRFSFKPTQIIIIGFIAIILIGACFLTLPISSVTRQWTPFVDSVFMSASAVCVTGMSTLSLVTHFSIFGQVVILVLMQIGGLGFMTAATFIMMLIKRKISFKDRLAIQDSLSHDTIKGVVKLVRAILVFTLVCELAGTVILLPFFVKANGAIGVWQALFTSISAFCNAGFDVFVPSADGQVFGLLLFRNSPIVLITIATLVFLGGIGFFVIVDLKRKHFRFSRLSLHSKIVLSINLILLLLGSVFYFAVEYSNPATLGNESFFNKLLLSIFESISVRTAGFNAINHAGLTNASKVFSSVLMFIGASPGSTGGGIKTTTFAVLMLVVVSIVRGNTKLSVFGHSINIQGVFKAIAIFMLGMLTIAFLTIFILIAEANNSSLEALGLYSTANIFLDAVSTFSTTGISSGITSYLSPLSKVATIVVMFFGRIGILNLGFALFTDKGSNLISYPEGSVLIG